jgi:4'-phosphopantetheinyl transferase EntD
MSLIVIDQEWQALLHQEIIFKHCIWSNSMRDQSIKDLRYFYSRQLAKQVLFELGQDPIEVMRNRNGSADWPSVMTGSISHSKLPENYNYTVVAGCLKSSFNSIGIDIEFSPNITPRMWRYYLLDSEINYLQDLSVQERHFLAAVIWVMKEAVIKASFHQNMLAIKIDIISKDGSWVKAMASVVGRGEFDVTTKSFADYLIGFAYAIHN